MSKPVANLKSGSKCQFCTEMGSCLLESGLGENDCQLFIPKKVDRDFNLNIKCRVDEAKEIHADVTFLAKRCDFELARSLIVGNGMRVPFFREMKNILYQHLRKLNQILPNVINRKTPFMIVSRVRREKDWKEDYKTLMKKLRDNITPEQASANLRDMAACEDLMRKFESEQEKEEKPCGSSGESSPPLPLFGDLASDGK